MSEGCQLWTCHSVFVFLHCRPNVSLIHRCETPLQSPVVDRIEEIRHSDNIGRTYNESFVWLCNSDYFELFELHYFFWILLSFNLIVIVIVGFKVPLDQHSRNLRSSSQHLLSVGYMRTVLSSRCFKHSAALNWNDLPYDIRAYATLSMFLNVNSRLIFLTLPILPSHVSSPRPRITF